MIAGVINGHVACKYLYVRIFRGSNRMHQRSLLATGSWVAIAVLLWTIAWIIAEAIPVFNNLLSLIVGVPGSLLSRLHANQSKSQVALFASWFTCKPFQTQFLQILR